METVRIQTGATEQLMVLALDDAMNPLTGLTDILIMIQRTSDGQWFDFSDLTFKAAGWSIRQQALAEINDVLAPGQYYYSFDTSTIVNATPDDTYRITAVQFPGTSVKNVPQVGELKVGQFTDNVDVAISSRAAPGAEVALTAGEREALVDAVMDEPVAPHATAGSLGALVQGIYEARVLIATQAVLLSDLKRVRQGLVNRLELAEGSTHNWILYDDDGVTPLTIWNVTGPTGQAIKIAPTTPAKRIPA